MHYVLTPKTTFYVNSLKIVKLHKATVLNKISNAKENINTYILTTPPVVDYTHT